MLAGLRGAWLLYESEDGYEELVNNPKKFISSSTDTSPTPFMLQVAKSVNLPPQKFYSIKHPSRDWILVFPESSLPRVSERRDSLFTDTSLQTLLQFPCALPGRGESKYTVDIFADDLSLLSFFCPSGTDAGVKYALTFVQRMKELVPDQPFSFRISV